MTGNRHPERGAGARRKLSPVHGALLLGLSSALCLIGGELYVRAFHAAEVDADELRRFAGAANLRPIARASANPELVFELRPGLDVTWVAARVVTDDSGCRTRPGEAAVQDAALRVALVGDSVPFGWGVEYAETYGAVLERMLEKHGSRSVRLRNFSVPGYNSHHNRIVVRDRVLAWDPDLLILHYDHNDADPIGFYPESYMGPEYGDNPLGSALIKFVMRRVFTLKTEWHSQRVLPSEENPNLRLHGTTLYGGGQYDWHVSQIEQLGGMLKEHGVPAMALVFNAGVRLDDDLSSNEEYTKLHAPIGERLRALGFTVVDTYVAMQPYLRKHGWSDMRHTWLHSTDAHPNPATHRYLASVLFEAALAEPRLAQLFSP